MLAALAITLAALGVVIGVPLLLQAYVVKPYRVPSTSMLPTLEVDQRILAERVDTHPGIGDVVVFHPPRGADLGSDQCGDPAPGLNAAGSASSPPCDRSRPGESDQTFVKRVVGLPGDVLRIEGGHVIRNGTREADAYIDSCGESPECTFSGSIRVPAGEYYMMGDNRGASDDSRYWGPVPQSYVIGVVVFTYWPPDRIGAL